MIQDLEFGFLDNQYRPTEPAPGDVVVCARGKDLLVCRSEDRSLTLPRWEQVQRPLGCPRQPQRQGFMAQISWKRAGRWRVPVALATVTSPSSRITSTIREASSWRQ